MSAKKLEGSGRGGERKGAGRPCKNKPTTKATIYLEDRELLNSYAEQLNIPVNDLLHKLIRHPEIKNILETLK
ncbi:MAG: hypothetical protein GX638_10740 [Crenarchaeota archaeon]|nr:hypothetical protein [Thermoproteota archaeon]